MKKIVYLSLAVILLFSSILSSCSLSQSSTTSSTATSGSGVLTLTSTDPFTLDPATSNEALSAGYIMQIYSGLLKLDNNLEPVPDIAESMPTLSSDGLTYTFHLRRM